MFKLRVGYLISGLAIGSILLLQFFWSLPDGKLHLVFCDVGQGDAAYIRFPDGRDMLIDGGPNDKVLGCLGRHMPFWDRQLNLVVLTHPQKDHLQGLISVLERFKVDYFLRSDVDNATEGYQKLLETIKTRKVPAKLVAQGEQIKVGRVKLAVLWPSEAQLVLMRPAAGGSVLGAQTSVNVNVNDASVVLWLHYGSFDALLTGDADSRVEAGYREMPLSDSTTEVLKVPHHGSRTGMTEALLDWLKPSLAVLSVGKNNYGHPAGEILKMLRDKGIKILRTDENGDIEVVSDGNKWIIKKAN